jgi:uncharacterized protein (DUF2147 family)
LKYHTKVTGALLLLGIVASPAAVAANDAKGVWRLKDGRVTVRVNSCGSNLCGFVVALAEPLSKAGKPKVDHENPDPVLRSRPIIGLQILTGMRPDGQNRWRGTIYNADDGRTYSSYMRLKGEGTMQVKGCVGPFCKTMTFQRLN